MHFVVINFSYYIPGTLTQSDRNDYPAGSSVKLVIYNFEPYLFSRFKSRKHNKILKEIEYPGIISTIKGRISYSKPESVAVINSGFEFTYKGEANSSYAEIWYI